MKRRYVTKSLFVDYTHDGEVCMTADEVIIEDEEPDFTGLITPQGDRIYRQRETVPFGFQGAKVKA